MEETIKIAEIEKKLGYEFKNKKLLIQAFSRSSYINEADSLGRSDNEVLEFIGDSVLGMIITKKLTERYIYSPFSDEEFEKASELLYAQHPELPPLRNDLISPLDESELSRMRIELVQSKTLAAATSRLELQKHLLMSKGDIKNNIQEEQSVKEDLFEAIVGAVTLDCGWNIDIVSALIDRTLGPDELMENGFDDEPDYISLVENWWTKAYGEKPNFSCNISKNVHLPYQCFFTLGTKMREEAVSGAGKTERGAIREACKEAWSYIQNVNTIKSRILNAVGKPKPDRAVNQLQELWHKGIIPQPIYEFNQTDDISDSGNPLWECECVIGELVDRGIGAVCESKAQAKKEIAYESLVYLCGITFPYKEGLLSEKNNTNNNNNNTEGEKR